MFTVRKEGPNQGRQFYSCPTKTCDFFAWKDGAGSASNNSFNNGGGGGGGGGNNGGGGGRGGGFSGNTSNFNNKSKEVSGVKCNCNKNAIASVYFTNT